MTRKQRVILFTLLLLPTAVIVSGYGGGTKTGAKGEAVTKAAVGTPAAAATISGIIHYKGKVPIAAPIDMKADPVCVAKHKVPLKTQTLVLGPGNTLANVLVQVKGGLTDQKWEVPTEPVVMDQRGCNYSPHVMAIRVGQPFKVLNSDGLLHNVHVLSKRNRSFNMAMPSRRKEAVKTFRRPEAIFPIKCDVHAWMRAYLAVMSHPFFDITKEEGKFKIEGLAPGTYEIEAWHEKLGTQTVSITVAKGEKKTANFTFSAKKGK